MGNMKRLAISMSATLIAFAVQIGINFYLTPYIVGSLGSEAYGFVPLVNNIIGYASILTTAVNAMAGRFISLELNGGNVHKANVYFNSVLTSDIILAVVLAIPCFVFSVRPDLVMNVPNYLLDDVRLTFMYAAIGMEMSLIFSVFGVVYYVKNRLEKSSIRTIEGNLLRAVVLVALFTVFSPKIYYVTASVLILNLYTCMANWYYTKRLMPELSLNFRQYSFKAVKDLVSGGTWNSINSLSYTLLISLDLYLANLFVGANIGGQYSLAKIIPLFVTNLGYTFSSVLAPQVMIYYAKKQYNKLLQFVRFAMKFMGVVMTLPIGFLIVFGEDFFKVWVPTENSSFLHAMSVVTLFALIPTCCTMPANNLFTVTNKLKLPALVTLVCGILNIVLTVPMLIYTDLGIWAIILVAGILDSLKNLLFITSYSGKAVGASAKTFLLTAVRSCCAVIPTFFVCFFCHSFIRPDNWLSLILSAIACMLVAFPISLLLTLNKSERHFVTNYLKAKFFKFYLRIK